VAQGDLEQRLVVEVKGEVAELAETINRMTRTLATFAEQVTGVAREVGSEGKLGGQADVPGAAGTWRKLTDNVNQLAATLTSQIRAMAEVATAVATGDLTRSIGVEASGEVAVLKDNVNEMIRNLRESTRRNTEQDWLKTNLARFARTLQGHRALSTVSELILSELAPLVNAQHGVFYVMDSGQAEGTVLRFLAGYAYRQRPGLSQVFRVGEGLVGQCAVEKRPILVNQVPSEYVTVSSGLGEAPPLSILVMPVLFEGEVHAVIELASFEQFGHIHQDFLAQATESIGVVLNTIEATMRTEELLKQSQSLTDELRRRQEQLQGSNEELEQKALLLAQQNREVALKNLEVEEARHSLEEKAEQLALTSRYKSEFLANMSHELRTPLNSLLILAQELVTNADRNLTDRQVEFAQIIKSSGDDLLTLINDILELSKIESGTVALEIGAVRPAVLGETMERLFRPVADTKGLSFEVRVDDALPEVVATDGNRLQQILRNLLSNAFKFTDQGGVVLQMKLESPSPPDSPKRVEFQVTDTGIGIPADKQQVVFEMFQQADGTTSRRYGGTGLGLAISRELVQLLRGEIRLQSRPGQGSTFSVFLPVQPPAPPLQAQSGGQEPVFARATGLEGPRERAIETHFAAPLVLAVGLSEAGREALDRALPEGGIEVQSASSPEAANAVLAARPGAIVILEPGELARAVLSARPPAAAGSERPVLISLSPLTPAERTAWTRLGVQVLSGASVPSRLRRLLGAVAALPEPAPGLSSVAPPEPQLSADETASALAGRRVLVVDDDVRNLFALTAFLERQGMDVTTAESGGQALELLDGSEFEIVLLDVMMPGFDGHQLIREIRGRAGLEQLPLIAVTAKAMPGDRERTLEGGASEYIAKPVRTEELGTLLVRTLGAVPVR